MAVVGDHIVSVLKKMYPSEDIESFNHMTVLFYIGTDKNEPSPCIHWQKRHCRRHARLSFHRDQQYSADGKFMHNSNSQKENSFTCILTVGDSRELEFALFCHEKDENTKCKRVKRLGEFAKRFKLSHGSLFILHFDDEKPLIRELYEDMSTSFFKHGNVMFGGQNEMSIALVYRVTSQSISVYKNTGKHYVKKTEDTKCKTDTDILYDFMNDTVQRNHLEAFLRGTYFRMKEMYKF